MNKTLIIGQNSNLSQRLKESIDGVVLISSREIIEKSSILSSFQDETVNIIFNNFQPATKLHNIENATQYINNAIVSTAKVLDSFQDSKNINQIIYTSSSSVYGNNILCKESDELKPMNLHASLKVANEKLIEQFCKQKGIYFTIARIFNMYGGEDKFSIISKIIKAVRDKEVLTIVNNGNAIRDFIHIDDVVKIYKVLLNTKDQHIINIGTGNGISIKTILDMLKNNSIELQTNNIIRDELKISTADNTLLLSKIGQYSFQNMESYLKNRLAL